MKRQDHRYLRSRQAIECIALRFRIAFSECKFTVTRKRLQHSLFDFEGEGDKRDL